MQTPSFRAKSLVASVRRAKCRLSVDPAHPRKEEAPDFLRNPGLTIGLRPTGTAVTSRYRRGASIARCDAPETGAAGAPLTTDRNGVGPSGWTALRH